MGSESQSHDLRHIEFQRELRWAEQNKTNTMGSLTSAIADKLKEQEEERFRDLREPKIKTFNVIKAVQDDLQLRAELGLKKYGTTLDRKDLTTDQWLEHTYQELLDAACYIKKLLSEKTNL